MPRLEEAARTERRNPNDRHLVVMQIRLEFLLHDLLDLPSTVALRDVRLAWNSNTLDLLLESHSFPARTLGEQVPQINPVYKRIEEHGMSGYYLEQLPLFSGVLDGPHAPQEPLTDGPMVGRETPFEAIDREHAVREREPREPLHVTFTRDERRMPNGTWEPVPPDTLTSEQRANAFVRLATVDGRYVATNASAEAPGGGG